MVELIPKQEQKPVFGQLFFLITSAAIFSSMVGGYFILQQLRVDHQKVFDSLQKTLTEDTRPLEQNLEERLVGYQEMMQRLEVALGEREDILVFLGVIEETIHPGVYLTNAKADVKTPSVVLSGEASDFFTLEQQRLVWKERTEFESVDVRKITLSQGGGVTFEVEFIPTSETLNAFRHSNETNKPSQS